MVGQNGAGTMTGYSDGLAGGRAIGGNGGNLASSKERPETPHSVLNLDPYVNIGKHTHTHTRYNPTVVDPKALLHLLYNALAHSKQPPDDTARPGATDRWVRPGRQQVQAAHAEGNLLALVPPAVRTVRPARLAQDLVPGRHRAARVRLHRVRDGHDQPRGRPGRPGARRLRAEP